LVHITQNSSKSNLEQSEAKQKNIAKTIIYIHRLQFCNIGTIVALFIIEIGTVGALLRNNQEVSIIELKGLKMKTRSIKMQETGKYTLIFGGLVLAGILFFAVNTFAAGVVVGEEAPDFTAFTTTGEKLSLSDLQGETVFMAFWSTWCSRSREELAYLKELSERYPSLVFVAVNSEAEATGIKSLVYMRQAIDEYKLPVAIVVDRGMKIWNRYEVNALPTSLIIGADGSVLFSEANFFWASAGKFQKVLSDLSAVSSVVP